MSDVTKQHVPFRLNVDGDFYVEDGCCITCGVMHEVAPELFSWSDDPHCFVSKQPSTPVELEQMIEATDATEIDCVRYRGTDAAMLRRLVERGQSDLLDNHPPADAKPYSRNQSLFEVDDRAQSADLLASEFAVWIQEAWPWQENWSLRSPRTEGASEVSSLGGVVEFRDTDRSTSRRLVVEAPLPHLYLRLTNLVFAWQSQNANIRNIRWLTSEELSAGADGLSRPA